MGGDTRRGGVARCPEVEDDGGKTVHSVGFEMEKEKGNKSNSKRLAMLA
jgi:hypothetical protein